MRFKRLLALLLAAALALAVLVGCGSGQQSAARVLLNLLDGKYPNISIEIDPDLEADLRQAISQAEAENAGDDDAVIRAALEKLVGSTVTFRNLRNGQKGETAFDLVFYAGSDPDKAAQAAYSQWNPILSNVPDDGKYDTSLAMVETNSGVWMLVKATVEKAGSRDDGPDPVTLEKLSVTAPTGPFHAGGYFYTTGMVVTATYSNGKQEIIDATRYTATINGQPAENYRFTEAKYYSLTVSFGGQTATVTITVHDNANGYYEDNDTYFVTGSNGLQKLYDDLKVTGDSFASAKITLNSSVTLDENWNGENITFTGELNGNGNTITMKGNRKQGLFDEINGGTVENVHLQIDGTIRDDSGAVGGIAGTLRSGTVTSCSVTGGSISVSISVSSSVSIGDVGGVVGFNFSGSVTACYSTSDVNGDGNTGGVVGWNLGGGTVTACYHAGTVQGSSSSSTGGVVGYNNGTGTACYWSGSPDNDNGRATKVDGTNVTWQTAVDAMNTALGSGGWQYELTAGNPLPTLTNQ